jgi:hypothetical protein
MNDTLLLLITIFVALAALAMLIQACMLVGIFVVVRRLQQKILPMVPEIQSVIGVTRRAIERSEKQIERIGATSAAILDSTKEQLAKIDELLTEFNQRARVQMDRAELVLDDSMNRLQQTVKIMQSGVVRPVREVYGVVAGLRATLAHLGRSRRPTVDHVTSDEEMFI